MGDVTDHELLEHRPRERQPHDREHGAREAVERLLRAPAGRSELIEALVHSEVVGLDVTGEDVLRGELARDESLVDAVSRDRVDDAGCVADDEAASTREPCLATPHRQAVPAQVGQVVQADAVALAEVGEMHAEPRAFRSPPADADVDVIALREDPAVTAWQRGELEHQSAAPLAFRQAVVRKVALERDAVHDSAAEPERLRRDAVRSVGADDCVDADRLAVDPKLPLRLDVDAHAVPERHTGRGRLLDEKCIEPAPLCHQAEHLLRAPFHDASVLKTAAHTRDPVLDDGLDRERQLSDRAHRQAAAARLVTRKRRLVYEQNASVSACETVSRRRAGRAGADDRDVKSLHGSRLQWPSAQGGVPERPKGTGCKPVGSAYGGSNPPAPIYTSPRGRIPRCMPGIRRSARDASLPRLTSPAWALVLRDVARPRV